MPQASAEIVLPAGPASSITFLATAVLPHGDPLAGANLELRIEGDGSFDPAAKVQEATRVADSNGEVFLTWYPDPGPAATQEVRSKLWVFCDFAECLVVVERQG
jgi:hypothetical protein